MQLITDSRLRAFRRCRRLHYFKYQLLKRAIVVAKPLGVGTLAHVALEAWWRWWLPREAGGRRYPEPLEAALAAMAERVAEGRASDGEISPFDFAAVRALMVGYDARWFDSAKDDYDVIAVEAPFVCALVNPDTGRTSQTYRRGGKIDVVLRRQSDGVVGFMEHKTSGSSIAPESSYWAKLRMDSQVSTYYDGIRSIGADARFCIYDVLAKPGQEPLKATPEEKREFTKGVGCKACGGKKGEKGSGVVASGPLVDREVEVGVVETVATNEACEACGGSGWKKGEEPRLYAKQRDRDETVEEYKERVAAAIAADPNAFYQRCEVVRLDGDIREFLWDQWHTVKSLHETRLAGRHARNTDACFAYNRACEFFDACSGVASIDDETIYRTGTEAHEELGDENALRAAAAAWSKERED